MDFCYPVYKKETKETSVIYERKIVLSWEKLIWWFHKELFTFQFMIYNLCKSSFCLDTLKYEIQLWTKIQFHIFLKDFLWILKKHHRWKQSKHSFLLFLLLFFFLLILLLFLLLFFFFLFFNHLFVFREIVINSCRSVILVLKRLRFSRFLSWPFSKPFWELSFKLI